MIEKIIGNSFVDERGTLLYSNELDLSEIKRMYVIENKDLLIQRAWQGHRIEKRWFVAVKGKFLIKLVKIDDFENPSDDLEVHSILINSEVLETVAVAAGYASSIQALEVGSKLIVFSNYKIGEVDDNYRYNPTRWK
ncbi:sugar epimerase [Flavobacterium sp. CAN_S2]|jgi:dTDP-4-dehydrorhamnose 3,5-epimerase-like enzyme|uniref:sugar epimerase n=1 Tax=Flavobacterium sp. CAN_S2 TaxID=2787726 RepID=UPI0018C99972